MKKSQVITDELLEEQKKRQKRQFTTSNLKIIKRMVNWHQSLECFTKAIMLKNEWIKKQNQNGSDSKGQKNRISRLLGQKHHIIRSTKSFVKLSVGHR